MSNQVIVLPEWETLLQFVRSWNFGDQVSHNDVAQIMMFSLPKDYRKYQSHVSKARIELEKEGICLRSVRKFGYEKVPLNKNIQVVDKKSEQSLKTLKRAATIAVNTDSSKMAVHDKMALDKRIIGTTGLVSIMEPEVQSMTEQNAIRAGAKTITLTSGTAAIKP